jgi:hypothetical protein
VKTMTRALAKLGATVAFLTAILVAILALAGGASADPTYPPSGGNPGGIHVSNPHPAPGGTVVVTGQGCTANAPVTVYLDNQQVQTGTTDSNGAYNITVTVPSNASSGSHTITVKGADCAGSGVTGVDVDAPDSASGSGLASTGVAVVGIAALGVVLLAGGAMMLLASRRRKHV